MEISDLAIAVGNSVIDGGMQSPGLFVSESTARGGRSLRVNIDEHVPTFHVDIMKVSDAYTDAIGTCYRDVSVNTSVFEEDVK